MKALAFFKKKWQKFLKKSSAGKEFQFIEVEVFQVKNLIQNQVPFLFYRLCGNYDPLVHPTSNTDGSPKNPPLSTEILSLLQHSQKITASEIMELSFSQPVVLVCADGNLSKKTAFNLSRKWNNIFYLKGGWQGKTPGH